MLFTENILIGLLSCNLHIIKFNLPKCAVSFFGLKFFLLLFKYSHLHFHPTTVPPPHTSLPPTLEPTPLALSICPLHIFIDGPSPVTPYYLSPPSSLVTVSSLF